MPPVGFEPTISACERPQTYSLDRAATGTCKADSIVVETKKSVRLWPNYNLSQLTVLKIMLCPNEASSETQTKLSGQKFKRHVAHNFEENMRKYKRITRPTVLVI